MLDSVSIWASIRLRLSEGPLGPHLDSFVVTLQEQGYKPSTVRRHILAADKLTEWMRRRRKTAEDLDEVTVERYIESLGRYRSPRIQRGRPPDAVHGAHKLAEHLWQQGVARRSVVDDSEAAQWLGRYDAHLEKVKGLSPGTRRVYLRYTRAFISAKFGTDTLDWSEVTAQDVTIFDG